LKKIVLITGATSGIGKACAVKFATNGYNIIITGRRKERLEKIKSELEEQYKIKVLALCFDVQQRKEVFDSLAALPSEWKQIDILINNAGLALGRDSFENADIDDWEQMLHTNVDENGNVYCASKFAVDAISKAMRIDLLKYGIKVTSVNPGAVETEFSEVRYKGDKEKAAAAYKGYQPLTPEDIAGTIWYCATLPPHVCINDLVITCTRQAGTYYFHKTNE
jgi:3-hydroxy acid dehydrogenase/malonic semialdehyde reductase